MLFFAMLKPRWRRRRRNEGRTDPSWGLRSCARSSQDLGENSLMEGASLLKRAKTLLSSPNTRVKEVGEGIGIGLPHLGMEEASCFTHTHTHLYLDSSV